MSRLRLFLLLTLGLAGTAARAEPPAILKAIPKQAGFVLVVENPRQLVDTTLKLRAVQEAAALPAVREALDGTAVRRAFQFLKSVERETDENWPSLLEKTSGHGAALAISYGPDGSTDVALLAIEGQDEATVAKVFDLMIRAVAEERTRQGRLEPMKHTRRGDAQVVEVEKELFIARLGTRTLISNKSRGITAALDLAAGVEGFEPVTVHPTIEAARKLLPNDPLAWFWLDFASLKNLKATKDFFEATRKDVFQTLFVGTTVDCLRRSDFVAGALVKEKAGLRFTVRLPAGREGFPPEFALHVPPADKSGSLPFLEPPGVLYSQSFHLDLATFWTERDKLIAPAVREQLEKGEQNLSKVLPGAKLGDILTSWGAYHRFVVVNLDKPPYTTEPGQKLPGFGYVTSMKDPQFGKSVEGLIRAGGLLVSLSQGMKSLEETHDGVKLFGYRFPEDRTMAGDESNLRYNFEPTFAIVDDQFIAGSTMEVAKKLVTEVKRTAKQPGAAPVGRAKPYAAAGAEALAAAPDATITDAMLRQAISLAEAKQQVEQLGQYLRTLGTFTIDLDEPATRYSFDLVWRFP